MRQKRLTQDEVQNLGRYVARTTKPLSEIAREQGIGLRTLMRFKAKGFFLNQTPQTDTKPEKLEDQAFDVSTPREPFNLSQREQLEQASENLSSILFHVSQQVRQALECGESVRGLPVKTITDAIDKLQRLQIHIANGGAQKVVQAKVDLTESLIQDLLMETLMELERQYPQINSKNVVKELFREQLPRLLTEHGVR